MIPVLINNRDLLDSVQKQIAFFQKSPDAYIVLIDNASTYPPLREWYDSMTMTPGAFRPGYADRWEFLNADNRFLHCLPHELITLPTNGGPRTGTFIYPTLPIEFDYYFLSDADMDYSPCDPLTLLSDLQAGLEKYPNVEGAGVSISLDFLPDTKMVKLARDYERLCWKDHPPADLDWWLAPCDTAGVLRRVSPQWLGGYTGIRSTKHVARHLPWYFVAGNWVCPSCHGDNKIVQCRLPQGCCCQAVRIPPDFAHYYQHANPSGTAYTSFVMDKTRNK